MQDSKRSSLDERGAAAFGEWHAAPTPFTILPATWRDVGELRALEAECFGEDAWPLLDVINVLTIGGIVRLKAVAQERMIGFIAGDPREGEIAWITTLGVRVPYRRLGIASMLLERCELQMQRPFVRLCVRSDNQPALQLYAKAGYRHVSVWWNYYRDGQDAYVLEKELAEFKSLNKLHKD